MENSSNASFTKKVGKVWAKVRTQRYSAQSRICDPMANNPNPSDGYLTPPFTELLSTNISL